MKKFIKVISIVLVCICLSACTKQEKEMKIDEGVVLQYINDIDPSYSLVNYNKLGSPSVRELKNNNDLVVKITGNYLISAPGSIQKFVDILFPEELKYPNIDSKYNKDSDGHLYLDPGEFTIINGHTQYNDVNIKIVLANTKDDIQDIEKCDIIYMDLEPTTYSKISIPELGLVLSNDVTIQYAFFKKADLISETDTETILQYSMNDSGILFIFNKDDDSFKSIRIFSNNKLDGYRYNNLLR